MIRDILIDLDDTIFDFQKAESSSLKKTLNDFGVKLTDKQVERYSEINLMHWKMLEKGELTHEQVKVKRYEMFFKEIGVDRTGVEGTRRYEDYLHQSYFMLDGAREMLESLYKGYRISIITNGLKKDQQGRIDGAGIGKYFYGFFNSQDIGYSKPDIKFFDYCIKSISDFNTEKTVVVGDSLTSDILGGINAKIKTIWFNRKGIINSTNIKPDYEIKDLKELKPLIDSL